MRLFAEAFWLQKSGSAPAEYEDAYQPTQLPVGPDRSIADFRVAIADGAAETSFSRLWAKLLVWSYVHQQRFEPDNFALSLQRAQKWWHKALSHMALSWFAEEKVRSGAAAAFLGVHLRAGHCEVAEGSWDAIAVGDCCLVQLRDQQVVGRFPVVHSSEFSSRPFLLSSSARASTGWRGHLRTTSGRWKPEDSLYLMSDALAAWFMTEDEGGRAPWEALRDLGTAGDPSFSDWIGKLRSSNGLRNDDVTLLRIDLVV